MQVAGRVGEQMQGDCTLVPFDCYIYAAWRNPVQLERMALGEGL